MILKAVSMAILRYAVYVCIEGHWWAGYADARELFISNKTQWVS